jgi:hypothetical protein
MTPEEELRRILISAEEQSRQSEPKQGLVSRILEAAARGLSTALSEHPGEILAKQLSDVGEERQREKQRRQSLVNVGTQFQLSDLANRMAEGRTIKAEEREQKYKLEAEQRAKERDVEMFFLQLSGQKQMKNLDYENQVKLLDSSNNFTKMMKELDQNFAIRMEETKRRGNFEDQSKAAQQNLIYSLIGSKVFTGEQSALMLRKIQQGGEGLDSKDLALLNKAAMQLSDQDFQRKLKLELAQHSGSGQFSGFDRIQHEAAVAAMTSARTEEMSKVQLQDGTTRIIPARKDQFGRDILPQGSKYLEPASYGERLMYFYDQYGVTQKFRVGQQGGEAMGQQTGAVNYYLNLIQKDRAAGKSDEEIKAALVQAEKDDPANAEAIRIATRKDAEGTVERERKKVEAAAAEASSIQSQIEKINPIGLPIAGLDPERRAQVEALQKKKGALAEPLQKAKKLEDAQRIVTGLEKQLSSLQNQLARTPAYTIGGSRQAIRDKIKDVEERLRFAQTELAKLK